jgi:hypothetical protein
VSNDDMLKLTEFAQSSNGVRILEQRHVGKAIDACSRLITQLEKSEISESAISIRLCGPDKPQLTLIDLPGLVRSTTAGCVCLAVSSPNKRCSPS